MDCHGLRPRRDRSASLPAPPSLCDSYLVFASAAKQSTSQTAQRPTMDCRVVALLAETEARLCEPFPSLRTATPSLRTATPSLRAPPRLCERSEAIHPSDSAVLNHGL